MDNATTYSDKRLANMSREELTELRHEVHEVVSRRKHFDTTRADYKFTKTYKDLLTRIDESLALWRVFDARTQKRGRKSDRDSRRECIRLKRECE